MDTEYFNEYMQSPALQAKYGSVGAYVNFKKSQEPYSMKTQFTNDLNDIKALPKRFTDGITGASSYINDKFTNFKDNKKAFDDFVVDFLKNQGMYGKDSISNLPKITSGVLAGKNLQSLFGTNDLTDMYANQVDKYQNTYDNLGKNFSSLDEEELEFKKQNYFSKFLQPAIMERQLNFDRQNTINDAQGYDATGRGRAFDYAGRDNEYGTHRSTITNKNAQINQDAGRRGYANLGTHTATNTAQEAQDYQDRGRGQRFEKGGRVGYFFGGLAARGMKR